MVYELHITDTASRDLDSIYAFYQETFSQDSATKVLKSLKESLDLMAFAPTSWGTLNDKVKKPSIHGHLIRMKPAKPHLIFYTIRDDQVFVIRIIHTSTNWLNELDNLFKHLPDQ